MNGPGNVFFLVYGCKVSQYEAQVLREKFSAAGWREVSDSSRADLVVVNSCIVTARAENEARRAAARALAHGPRVILTGCRARCAPGENFPALPAGVRLVDYRRLLEEFPDTREAVSCLKGRRRAFLKIEDGCDRGCAYCVVSTIRGPVRSKEGEEIRREILSLAENGYREIVFCGINLGLYGREKGLDLAVFLEELFRWPQLPANLVFRLSSLEPDLVGRRLLEALSSGPVVRHLHLPLQSGSDRVLSLMGRGYDLEAYCRTVNLARRVLPGLFLSTDLMVGFPGEAESDFRATLEAARRVSFDRTHVFRFSPRPGTPAFLSGARVPEKVSRERAAILRAETRCRPAPETGSRPGVSALPAGDAEEKTRGKQGVFMKKTEPRRLSLVIASGNPKKSGEIRRILSDLPGLELLDLGDFPPLEEPAETGRTFARNAFIKADAYARGLGRPVLAEDSGLAVDALGGRPGVLSARFAGPGKNDRENIDYLLSLMAGLTGTGRRASFVTVACLVFPGRGPFFFEGRCHGLITGAPRGRGGFGYDPVFLFPGSGRTFAEMSPAEKDRVSHRRRALEGVRQFLARETG